MGNEVMFVKRMNSLRKDPPIFLPAYMEHLTKQLTDVPPRNRDGFISPSSLGRCPTQVVHQLNSEKKVWKPEKMAESQDLLDVATLMHEFYQARGQELGILTNVEEFVEIPHWKVRGQIDGVLNVEKGAKTKRYLFEIKTVNSFKFSQVKKSGVPLKEHWPQNMVYLKAKGLKETRFLYVERDMLNTMEVPLRYDPEVMKKVGAWIRMTLHHHKTGTYPARDQSYWDKSWDCESRCHYHHACKLVYAKNRAILEDL